jgi:predicted O-methyltransferase YrrM
MYNETLTYILDTGNVHDRFGNTYRLHSSISLEKGEFIWHLVRDNKPERTLEVGCAYGVSSLFICDALAHNQNNAAHVIVDPHQSTLWRGVGIYNLEKAGFTFWELIEEYSEFALPRLVANERRFDFAFIDGLHRFENVLLDFFYIDRLLEVNGIIVFDDVDTQAVNKALRYILNYPNYEVMGLFPEISLHTIKRRSLETFKRGLKLLTTFMPGRMARELFDDSVFRPHTEIGLDRGVIALRKTSSESTQWDWYEPF